MGQDAVSIAGLGVVVKPLLYLEMLAYGMLALWMMAIVWKSSRGDHRTGDTGALIVGSFASLLVYRDWRILYVDDSPEAKVIMCALGICLCIFTGLAAKAYGRGGRI